jgi:alpha-galactosidase
MSEIKTVVIGAGSASFGLNTLASLMRSQHLGGSELALVDQDSKTLDLVERLALRVNQEWGSQIQITAHDRHAEALEGASFVILSIEAPPREALWRSDFDIPLKYSVRQPYAENGGPGGFVHAARNIPPVMEIVRDMEKICPAAWLVNFTNPMVRICDAVHRFSKIKVVGLCHQILTGYAIVGTTLAKDLDIQVPHDFTTSHAVPDLIPVKRQVAYQALERIEIQAAGLNHFTWMLSLRERESGEDLYPLFRQRWEAMDSTFEPLTRKIYEIFDIFPIPGDEHLCEYLPWVSDPITKPWEKFDLSLYDWDAWADLRIKGHSDIACMADGQASIDDLSQAKSEGAVEIIENIAAAGNHYHLAVNLPNLGQIPNLPEGAIVETPGLVTSSGIRGVSLGSLPETIAELCRRELTVVRLCVDASVYGDRQAALQCLLLDPVITDLDTAQNILDEYLETYRDHLPQFWG